ncbi:MAG: hypothetical protein ACRBK7_32215 [Acidimicrobiales bacterium]
MGSIETGQDPTTDSSTNDSPAGRDETTTDDQLLALYATALADGVEEALPGWVAAAVVRRLSGDLPDGLPENFEDRVISAGREAATDVGGRVRELLALDVDEQWTNPLTLIRTAIRYPNELLREIGVPTVSRDEQAQRFYPDDVFDLIPASFAELGPAVHDLGLSWGAAKAHVHLRRRREEEVA